MQLFGGQRQIFPVLGAQCAGTEGLTVDTGLRREDTVRQLLLGHFQTEDSHRHLLLHGHAGGDVQRKAGLAHTGTGCQNDQIAAAKAGKHGIQQTEAGGDALVLVRIRAVLGADPLVKGGIGEEDIVYLVLPYVRTAREGARRLGNLLEQYGTYEMNGIAFQDVDEIWWLETIGGHHWMARRVPDDVYVVMPNQLGLDTLDLDDALGEQKDFMCSADLRDFIKKYHLDLSQDGVLNPRDTFGSHDDADHVYNTPRAWYMLRYFNPNTFVWDGPDADFTPRSDDLPWCMVPEKKVTPEDVKYVLSSHYQGTPYDPYAAAAAEKGIYRPIGVNRNDFMALLQMRPDVPEDFRAVEWLAFASNAFNTMLPFYANVDTTPEYLSNTTGDVSTDNFYWASRLLAAMADASYAKSVFHIERYTLSVGAKSNGFINRYDDALRAEADPAARAALREKANEEIAAMAKAETTDALNKVLFELSSGMKNAYSRSDA